MGDRPRVARERPNNHGGSGREGRPRGEPSKKTHRPTCSASDHVSWSTSKRRVEPISTSLAMSRYPRKAGEFQTTSEATAAQGEPDSFSSWAVPHSEPPRTAHVSFWNGQPGENRPGRAVEVPAVHSLKEAAARRNPSSHIRPNSANRAKGPSLSLPHPAEARPAKDASPYQVLPVGELGA